MNSYFTKIPKWIRSVYPKQIWSFSNSKKEIFLTFDDGPTPEITDWVLNMLDQFDAKATFFCIGNNIEQNPTTYENILKAGHSVGNHTYSHEKGWKTKNEDYLNSVLKTDRIIEELKLKPNNPKLFRPPYGKIKRSQTKLLLEKGYKIVMWSILSWDFDTSITPKQCLNNVVKNAEQGNIIVFHDSVKAFERLQIALPKVLEYFSEKGFVFKRIS
ncbi:polysaccharide deacetylase family protein [Aureibaculum sp. A20]|uniref:Polysaccharide deacetylase family protein n=1 Tax=Aureibaculum flavum TaxID=2795986 RepID=A0ABS0WWN0_9FLAO|nr:polysaccharide deacetylase family protein [Aureibaculum flavum]MBJ2176381.1 polysaccharide deacetylase family protein [Aureibaculum flavum]